MQVIIEICWPDLLEDREGHKLQPLQDFAIRAEMPDAAGQATIEPGIVIITPQSSLWPIHRLSPCKSDSGCISLHHAVLPESDMFCCAVDVDAPPVFPDLSYLEERETGHKICSC